jgi:hypothetical protein
MSKDNSKSKTTTVRKKVPRVIKRSTDVVPLVVSKESLIGQLQKEMNDAHLFISRVDSLIARADSKFARMFILLREYKLLKI